LIVGIVVGLTGAGGALISIPLFLLLLGATLKEATVLSLVAVIIGTSINLTGQLKRVDSKIAIPLSLAGIVANYGTSFLKPLTPDLVVAGLLILIAVYSLWSVWSIKEDSQSKMCNQSLVIKSS